MLNTMADSETENSMDSVETCQLGIVEVVEAFTALRQDLKVQVRDGRQLQRTLTEALERLESKMTVAQAAPSGEAGGEARRMAEALAEVDETLQRILEGWKSTSDTVAAALSDFDKVVSQAGWMTRRLAAGTFNKLRQQLQASQQVDPHASTAQALGLMSERLRRLMQQTRLLRIDVKGQPFDPERMRALDVVDSPGTPASHVAEQLRPVYIWRDQVLRYAEVRLSK
jgi:GrpE